jgi:hypothetical protein
MFRKLRPAVKVVIRRRLGSDVWRHIFLEVQCDAREEMLDAGCVIAREVRVLEYHPLSYASHFVKLPSGPRREQEAYPLLQFPRCPVLFSDLRIELQPQNGAQDPVPLNLGKRFVPVARQFSSPLLSNGGVASCHFGELREDGVGIC